jgi:hypothetical protein
MPISQKETNIEKFTGSFSTEQQGCSIFINSTINSITDGFALGIYTYLMCRPSNWQLNARQLSNHFGCGRDKIYKYLNFLKDMGLLTCKTIREKGKFAQLHYTLHLNPKLSKSQSNKEISPCPDFPDAVKSDVEKADTYKTKNIKNKEYKKTTTTKETEKSKSSSIPIINKEIDEILLKDRKKSLQNDDSKRTEEEYLRQCSHHLDNGDKDKYTLNQRLAGLRAIIRKGFFEKPAGFDEKKIIKSIFSPKETVLIQTYQHALRMVSLGAKLKDYMPDQTEVKKAIKLMEKVDKNKEPLEKRHGLMGFSSMQD